MQATLSVPARFCGPAGTGNGGWVSGRLAASLPGAEAVTVTLRRPPPLETPLSVRRDGDAVLLEDDATVVAVARPDRLDDAPLPPVPFEVAFDAGRRFAGWAQHHFPGCFVCGTRREPPDALGLRPGPLPGQPGATATSWVPDPSLAAERSSDAVPPEILWAALDCPGAWTTDAVARPAVLGRFTVRVDALPVVGERCVVVGRLLAEEGRKALAATAAYGEDGRLLGQGLATWVAVPLERLRGG